MYEFLEKRELSKTLSRFNKIRSYHNKGYNNLLPIKVFLKYANNYQQIQLNTNFHLNAIIMDIDDENLVAEWDAKGLPTPTIQTLNKYNDKVHLVWLLKTPVYKKHEHAVAYYKAIVNSIKKLIGADPAYQNHQTKNFLNTKMYRVVYNDVSYELSDFRKFIDKNTNTLNKEYSNFDYMALNSRHIYLFEMLRKYGYSIAKEEHLYGKLLQKAEHINQSFLEPIKVKYIVKSVYNFCLKNRDNFRQKNRKKVMKFKKISNLSTAEYKEEVKRRQSKAAKRTSQIKKVKTAKKIKYAICKIVRLKKSITFENIAKYANISTSTARRNVKILTFYIKSSHFFIRSIRLIVQRAQRICAYSPNAFYCKIYPLCCRKIE